MSMDLLCANCRGKFDYNEKGKSLRRHSLTSIFSQEGSNVRECLLRQLEISVKPDECSRLYFCRRCTSKMKRIEQLTKDLRGLTAEGSYVGRRRKKQKAASGTTMPMAGTSEYLHCS